MKTNSQLQIIPMTIFEKAALTHFKCQPEDIEITMITDNKEAFVVYREKGYKISTREILRENIESQLTDKDAVHYINLGCWMQAIKHTFRINNILGDLIRTIEDTEQAKMLLIAVALGLIPLTRYNDLRKNISITKSTLCLSGVINRSKFSESGSNKSA